MPGKVKGIALAQMKRTYLEAIRVLVLDALSRMNDLTSTNPDEACINIPPFRVDSPTLNIA